jgi:WD40 repeat protein
VTSVAFVVNGDFHDTVLTGNDDGSFMLWSMQDASKPLRTVWPHGSPGPGQDVTVAMFSRDGNSVFTATRTDHVLKMWNVATGMCTRYFRHDPIIDGDILGAVLSSGGDSLLTACENGTTKLWNIDSGDCVRTFGKSVGHFFNSSRNSADLSQDGDFVIGINLKRDQEIAVLWTARTGKVCVRFEHPSAGVLCVALSSDSQFALTGGNDGTARIWNTISGDCVQTFQVSEYSAVTAATFAP